MDKIKELKEEIKLAKELLEIKEKLLAIERELGLQKQYIPYPVYPIPYYPVQLTYPQWNEPIIISGTTSAGQVPRDNTTTVLDNQKYITYTQGN